MEPRRARSELEDLLVFLSTQSHVLQREPALLWQQATCEPLAVPISSVVERRRRSGVETRPWLEWVNRPRGRDPCVLTVPTARARRCRLSPDGTRLLAWSEEAEVWLWDVASGRPVARWEEVRAGLPAFVRLARGAWTIPLLGVGGLRLHEATSGGPAGPAVAVGAGTSCFALDPRAESLAVGFENGRFEVTDVASGGTFLVAEHDRPVELCAFAGDGRHVLAHDGQRLRVWDLSTGGLILDQPDVAGETFRKAVLSANGQHLLLELVNEAAGVGWSRLWDLDRGTELPAVTGGDHAIEPIALSADGSRIVALEIPKDVGMVSAILELWSVGRNQRVASVPLGTASAVGLDLPVRFSADGRSLIFGTAPLLGPGEARLWDLETGECRILGSHSAPIADCDVSDDGSLAASCCTNGVIRLWRTDRSRRRAEAPRSHRSEVACCRFSPDGKRVVSSASSVLATYYDGTSAQEAAPMAESLFGRAPEDPSEERLALLAASRKISEVEHPAEIALWDAETGERIAIQPTAAMASEIAFSPSGEEVLHAGGNDLELRPAVEPFERRGGVPGHTGGYSPDGRRIVSLVFGAELRIWDASTLRLLASRRAQTGRVSCFRITPNGRFALISGHPEGMVSIDLDSLEQIASIAGAWRFSLAPDGRSVAWIGEDGDLVLWWLGTRERRSIPIGGKAPAAVYFDPAGRWLELFFRDGTAALLEVQDPTPAPRVGRSLARFPDHAVNRRFAVSGIGESVLRIAEAGSSGPRLAFVAGAEISTWVQSGAGDRLAVGDVLGRVHLLRLRGLDRPRLVAVPVRLWRFGLAGAWWRRLGRRAPRGRFEAKPTALCRACGGRFEPARSILQTIEGIHREIGASDPPCTVLPREAWNQPGLDADCPACAHPLRFTPFFA